MCTCWMGWGAMFCAEGCSGLRMHSELNTGYGVFGICPGKFSVFRVLLTVSRASHSMR